MTVVLGPLGSLPAAMSRPEQVPILFGVTEVCDTIPMLICSSFHTGSCSWRPHDKSTTIWGLYLDPLILETPILGPYYW